MDIKQTKNTSMRDKRVIITVQHRVLVRRLPFNLQRSMLNISICLPRRPTRRANSKSTKRSPTANCLVMHIDTSNQQSIHEFVMEFRKRFSRLDVLINNAGINLFTTTDKC